jgi:hypothetical protein
MALTFNGTTGYLEMAAKVVSAFPYTILVVVNPTSNGNAQFIAAQGQSNADRYGALWLDSAGSSAYANLRNPGNGDNATNAYGDWTAGGFYVGTAAFISTTSRKLSLINSTQYSNTTSLLDDTTNHDRFTIGSFHTNSASPSLFFQGDLGEVHIFNTAGGLSSANVQSVIDELTSAGSGTLPENLSGWVDGWKLTTTSDLTSIGGSRTLTLNGGVTNSATANLFTRNSSGGATLSGSALTSGRGTPVLNLSIGL